MRTAKFGGSNLRNPEDMRRITRAIASYDGGLAVVVSAFSGVTDRLLIWAKEAETSDTASREAVEVLGKMHEESIALVCSGVHAETARAEIAARLARLERLLTGVRYVGGLPDFTRDEILSCGERLSSVVLVGALRSAGVECAEALPEALGLVSDGRHSDAIADMDACLANVPAAICPDAVTVVPGFYGVSREGRVTLFGRGGSDYSAALIARCTGSASLDLWKDTPGFLTADPRMAPGARRIDTLSYAEAAELSYFGAKIMHPRTVEPLGGSGIPIRLFDIRDPNHVPKTLVLEPSTVSEDAVKGVSFTDDIGILRISGAGVGMRPGVLARATGRLDDHGINIKSVVTSQTSIDVILSNADLERARQALADSAKADDYEVRTDDGLSIIAAVGDGILERRGIAARVLGAVSAKGINVEIVSIGASPCAAYFYVRRGDRDGAVLAIHEELFERGRL